MTDDGFWSYPQYTVSFPPFEVVNCAHAILHVKGLPRAPMAFSLRAVAPDRSNALAAVDLNGEWVFVIRIRDDRGKELYSVSDSLSEWHMQQTGASASLWHESLRDLSFSPDREYVIEIQISGSQTPSGVFLEPRLAGGGNEY